MKYTKYHALGNDYLVLNPKNGPLPEEDEIIRICHRNFGLGSDGILYGPLDTEKADFGLRIINPDGSEAEKSGNGLRIFARYLHDACTVKNDPFTVDTLGGVVTCQVNECADSITVDMGQVKFSAERTTNDIKNPNSQSIGQDLKYNGKTKTVFIVDIGNPHCVVLQDEISPEQAKEDGAAIEVHTVFPNKTNVQFLKIIDSNNIQIEIWERGAGYTLASGSSSSAAAAVANRLGLCGPDITVHMPGGQIKIQIGENYNVRMTGPATRVALIDLDDEALRFEQDL